MMLHLLTTFTVFCTFKGIFARVIVQPEDLHVFNGESGFLNCTVEEGDMVSWSDPSIDIYFGTVGTSGIKKGDDAKLLSKYDNFYIISPEGSTFFNLNISEAQFKEDEGTYECGVFGGTSFPADVSISVLPDSVDISCTLVDCSELNGRVSQDDVTCNCSATGVFPELLNIIWEGAAGTPGTSRSPTSSGLTGTFDLRSEAVVQRTDGAASSITCSVGEYAKDPGNRGKSVTYISPMCSLEPPIEVCTAATFTCKVENQPYPGDMYFQFFFKNGTEISRGQESETVLNLEEGATVDLYCIACNSFMSHQSEVVTYTCPSGPPTTSPPTTTVSTTVTTSLTEITSPMSTSATTTSTSTERVTPTPTKGSNIGLIVGCSVSGVIVLVAVVVLVYWFCFRDQGSSKSNHNTDKDFEVPEGGMNNTVTASTAETTNSAAPVYGVVNKSTKKKSDNTDGNGVNAKLASPPEPTEPAEYASVNKPKSQPQAAPRSSAPPEKMELQYADLDHGNRGQSNEVRQPTNEPTEYATVQSVIV